MAKAKKKAEPKYIQSPINSRMLNYKVYYMSAAERIAYTLILFFAGAAAGYIFYGGLFHSSDGSTLLAAFGDLVIMGIVGVAAVLIFLPTIVRSYLKEKRERALQKQFKDLLENLAASLSSGNTVTEAFANAYTDMQNQYTERDYIIIELKEILDGLRNGHTLEEMLAAFSARTENEDIANFGNVITNCFRMGSDFKVAVRATRDIISGKNEIEDEIATKLASNKMQLNAMCVMPAILVMMLKLSSASFAENLATTTGALVTTLAVGIFVGAYFWGRKIVNVR